MTKPGIHPTGGPLGAFVTDIDLRQTLSADDLQQLENALAQHHVLFFRDQDITAEQHREFGQCFGPLLKHPSFDTVAEFEDVYYLDNDRENPSKIDEWHTDMSFRSAPAMGSVLLARIMPERGGDTLFSNLAAAYDALPLSIKKTLQGRTATHSYAWGFRDSLAEPGGPERLASAIAANPDQEHPVICRHPVNGRKIILVNRIFTRQINGLPDKESAELLDYLCDHMTQEQFVYRFQWQVNSIAFWDNRAVMHKPDNNYWPERRRVERVSIADAFVPSA